MPARPDLSECRQDLSATQARTVLERELGGLRLLRGRILARKHPDVKSPIVLPDGSPKTARLHYATVLQLGGAPRTRWGDEVPWDIRVGDVVAHVYVRATEKFRSYEDIVCIHVDEVLGVVTS